MYEPMPGSATVVLPTLKASEATTKNQPPDIDIIMFQISAGMRERHLELPEAHPRRQPERAAGLAQFIGHVRSDW